MDFRGFYLESMVNSSMETKKYPPSIPAEYQGGFDLTSLKNKVIKTKIAIVFCILITLSSCMTTVRVNGVSIRTKQRVDKQERIGYAAAILAGFVVVSQVKKEK